MKDEPPAGSRIIVDRSMYSTTYLWKNGEKSLKRYPVAAFLLFWLGGWTFGGFAVIKSLLTNDNTPLFGRMFMLFWLGGWALGETGVIYILYCMFRPQEPAKLTLSPGFIEYQPGTEPFNFNRSTYCQSSQKPNFFQGLRNKSYRIETRDISNLKLDQSGERQRLTFDIGAERIEIGEILSEPEREWLFEILQSHISG